MVLYFYYSTFNNLWITCFCFTGLHFILYCNVNVVNLVTMINSKKIKHGHK